MIPPAETDPVSIVRVIAALAFVLAILMGFAAIMKYASGKGLKIPGLTTQSARIKIVDSLALDARRRLVIVRCDRQEHLLLLGHNQDIVVTSNPSPDHAPIAETTS